MTRSGFGLTRPAWALAYGLPRAPATNPRAKAPRWREGSSKADRGRRLHGPWLRGSASHDANGIRRARKPGPIRRPRASDRSGAPLAARPQARESSKKSKFRGSKRRQTDDSFHPSLHFERIQTDALELAACDEARTVKVQKSFALPEPILCSGVPC